MKKILHIARSMVFGAALFSIAACGSEDTDAPPAAENQTYYGSVIELDGALDASGLRAALSETGRAQVKFEGEVTATCAKKGCWMDVASGEDTVFVRFQDCLLYTSPSPRDRG